MTKKTYIWNENRLKIALPVGIILMLLMLAQSYALPSGPVITYNNTQNVTPRAATQITTAGGSFTTLILNATTQTPRWKAYVGNVTGKLTLSDVNVRSVFDWSLSSVTGEVYATINSSVDWSSIGCADASSIATIDTFLNMSQNNPDTINRTFANTVHKSFYVGPTLIQNSTCRAIATYINGSAQSASENASFQEILLKDASSSIVFATLINQNTTGFNNQRYDFQMIVAENEFQTNPTTYYLYVELT